MNKDLAHSRELVRQKKFRFSNYMTRHEPIGKLVGMMIPTIGGVKNRPKRLRRRPRRTRISYAQSITKSHFPERLRRIFKACGSLCNPDVRGTSYSKKFGRKYRKIGFSPGRCRNLFRNRDIIARGSTGATTGPSVIPIEVFSYYTMDGRIPVRYQFANKKYTSTDLKHSGIWSSSKLRTFIRQAKKGDLAGAYGRTISNELLKSLKYVGVNGARVLVLGSKIPWVEAVVIAGGAIQTVTVEDDPLELQHPRMKACTPTEFSRRYLKGELPLFDIVVSYSRLENDGLGRPFSDILSLAMSWCVSKKDAKLILEVLRGSTDVIEYDNGKIRRIYGPIRLAFITTNWVLAVDEKDGTKWTSKLRRLGNHPTPLVYQRMS